MIFTDMNINLISLRDRRSWDYVLLMKRTMRLFFFTVLAQTTFTESKKVFLSFLIDFNSIINMSLLCNVYLHYFKFLVGLDGGLC